MISPYVGENKVFKRQFLNGELKVEFADNISVEDIQAATAVRIKNIQTALNAMRSGLKRNNVDPDFYCLNFSIVFYFNLSMLIYNSL
jgi:hypothetical protein